MLQNLHVKNLALIDEAEVDFSGGLNILTGETGAGKSIILGSVSLALGGRYSADMLRKGADKGLVELTFYVENPETVRKLEEMDLSPDGGQIIITRRFNGNRSVSRINGETVTLGRLKEAAQVLIDIHGQHEHQSLLYKKNHLAILDAFAKEAGEWKKKVADSYREYRRLEKELKEADKDEAERAKEISFLEFEIDEIENAGITAAECQSVEEDYRRMMQGKRIAENLEEAYLYTAGEGGISAAEAIGRAVRAAAVAAEHDDKSGELYEQLVEVENLIGDSGRELRCYLDSLSFEPEQFYETESRLNQINHLKVKYGDSAEAILQHKADDEERLLILKNYDEYLNELKGVLVKVGKEKEAEKIMDILVCLFPYIGDEIGKITEWYDSDLLRRSNRIAHPDKFERYFDFNIEEIDIKSFEVTRAIQKLGCGELEKYILELNQEGKSYAFLSEIKSAIPNIREERAKIIVTSILKSAYKLEEKSTGNLLMTSSRDYAEHMVIDLFEQIEKVNRKNFLEQLINSGELDSLPSIAHVINIIELGYGRLAAEGREKSKGRIISIEELEDVEQVFKQKVKTILKENSIFDFFDYRMILYLMENFDSQFMTQRIQQELKDDIHILCFLKSTVFTWIGNGIKYAVSKEYEKYLTKERILDAIQNTQATGEMFRLSKKNQEYCAAFYLDSIGKSDDEGEVSQKDAERMIEKWRER